MFGEVRDACRQVAERARQVRIDPERLPSYAASLPLEQAVAPELDPTRHYVGHADDTVAFFITLDAINFGSGYFPHLVKRPGHSGYFTVAASLNDEYRSRGPLTAERLTQLTPADCTRIFGQEAADEVARELMALFACALNDLGRFLLDGYDGSFVGLVAAADGSAERLARALATMPFFDDVARYDGLRVPFYKRAQITPADLAIAFAGEGPGRFHDLDGLTIFADNLVPHVLRLDGVLRYDPELAARIDREQPIIAGSPEEVEIRATALHAVELMVQQLREAGRSDVTAMGVDYLLWNRGQQPHYKRSKPRHRARTVYY
jgi:hypothetical protein